MDENFIGKKFFLKDAEEVARDLLGCVIVVKINGEERKAIIVETEAYYGENDPASRACQNGDLRETMLMDAGTILTYGVHNNWLVNFVTGKEGDAQAVLIRACEPICFEGDLRGPGKLTKILGINKNHHKTKVGDGIKLVIRKKKPIIESSFRIGVKKDLPEKLRFYIKDNKNVSR